MAKLGKSESAALAGLFDKPGWEVLTKLVAMTINELNSREVAGSNDFEIIRSVFIREGQVRALKEFFNGIENGDSLSRTQ